MVIMEQVIPQARVLVVLLQVIIMILEVNIEMVMADQVLQEVLLYM
jgi:hypothetical protein